MSLTNIFLIVLTGQLFYDAYPLNDGTLEALSQSNTTNVEIDVEQPFDVEVVDNYLFDVNDTRKSILIGYIY